MEKLAFKDIKKDHKTERRKMNHKKVLWSVTTVIIMVWIVVVVAEITPDAWDKTVMFAIGWFSALVGNAIFTKINEK